MLAMVNLTNPVIIAVMIGWMMTVVLHELAHGLVAYWGGDYTIKERGGLTLNPLQYIDPMISIVYPLIIFCLGGIPLSGGVTYVRRDLLRSKYWSTAVSLAGPATNLLIFFLLVLPFHPTVGWIHPSTDLEEWTTPQRFLATMAMLQFFSVCLNLFPIPPLDGFQAIAPFLDPQTRGKLMSPAFVQGGFFLLFILVRYVPAIEENIFSLAIGTLTHLGFGRGLTIDLFKAFYTTISGR